MKYITITSVIARVVSMICIFLFVKTSNDLVLYCIFYAFTTILIGIIGTGFALKVIHVQFVRIEIYDIINELKSGWYTFTTSISSKIFNTFGITVLGFLSVDYHVGIYSAIQKIPQLVLLLWSPIAQVLYPVTSQRMTASFSEGRKYVIRVEKRVLLGFVLLIFLISIFARQVVMIAFGKEYEEYHYLIYPLLVWIVFGIMNNFTGVQTLLAGGYSKEYSRCFSIGVIITIVLNVILIYIFGIVGAAVAPAISELLFGILLFNEVKRLSERGINNV